MSFTLLSLSISICTPFARYLLVSGFPAFLISAFIWASTGKSEYTGHLHPHPSGWKATKVGIAPTIRILSAGDSDGMGYSQTSVFLVLSALLPVCSLLKRRISFFWSARWPVSLDFCYSVSCFFQIGFPSGWDYFAVTRAISEEEFPSHH